jgi:hypothetical protein
MEIQKDKVTYIKVETIGDHKVTYGIRLSGNESIRRINRYVRRLLKLSGYGKEIHSNML